MGSEMVSHITSSMQHSQALGKNVRRKEGI